ncbi:MAG: DUF5623 domain-containing protein [Lysobacter sp.]|nr:DUF5623 domain-containing protein [Lysobacter sp.]
MSTVDIRPSTLDGIKRLANAIKRERNLKHHEALELAAQRAGFQNFRHAEHQLAGPSNRHALYLSAFWADRQLRTRGRETLTIWLPKPLFEIASAREIPHARNLGWFRAEAEDHLERRVDLDSQGEAHDKLYAAARAVLFMAATGLRPIRNLKTLESMTRRFDGLPGRDHSSEWFDPETEAWVYMDEPYQKLELSERGQWVAAKKLHMIQLQWEGIYVPGHSIPFLFCKDAALAQRLDRQLRRLQARRLMPRWNGDSEPYFSEFESPMRKASGKSRRKRPMPSYGERMGAVPYGARKGGEKSRWRPARRMPLDLHLTVGPLLSSLCVSGMLRAHTSAIGEVRTTLDDWLQMEYPGDEMTSEQFHSAYYGHRYAPIAKPQDQAAALLEVVQRLEDGYLDCKPRRDMVKKLRAVAAAVAG